MFCSHCGSKTDDGEVFCTNCGFPLPGSDTPPGNENEKKTEEPVGGAVPTGTPQGATNDYYNNVGGRTDNNYSNYEDFSNSTSYNSSLNNETVQPKKSKLPIIIIIIILIAGIAIGVYFAFGMFDGNSSHVSQSSASLEESSALEESSEEIIEYTGYSEFADLATYKKLSKMNVKNGFTISMSYMGEIDGISVSMELCMCSSGDKNAMITYEPVVGSDGSVYNEVDGEIIKDGYFYRYNSDTKICSKRALKDTDTVYTHPIEMLFEDAKSFKTETKEYNGETYTVDTLYYDYGDVTSFYIDSTGAFKYIDLGDLILDLSVSPGVENGVFDIPEGYTVEIEDNSTAA